MIVPMYFAVGGIIVMNAAWFFLKESWNLIHSSFHYGKYNFLSNNSEYIHHHHHHHVVPPARISLTFSRHFSQSFIDFGRSSGLHPVSSRSCYMYVRAGRPDFAWPYAGVHRSISLMSSSLLLQLCPACLVRLTCIVFVMGGKWPYSWCLVGRCHPDLFKNVESNIEQEYTQTYPPTHVRICLWGCLGVYLSRQYFIF